MQSTSSKDSIPSDGERNALVGYSAQFALAAKVVHRFIPTLQWIRVADPSAGVADDFQFVEASHRHALQVKWSQFPGSFTWSDLFGSVKGKPSLFAGLAEAWKRIRGDWDGPLTVHLCTNNFPSIAKPPDKSVLKTATDSPRHFAAFLSRSFVPVQEHLRLNPQDGWEQIAVLRLVTSWSDAWTMIKDGIGLAQNELTDFLRDFDLTFVPLDQSELLSPRDSHDQKHLAATLQGVVVDPARIVELDRSALMSRLDWSSRTRYQNPHRFPVPDTYTANIAARTALEDALACHQTGYIALIGLPGSGKSTLVEKVSVAGRLIRYYAFVPDAPDPLSGRGEAQSFLHDLSLALEEAGIYREGFGADLAGQRAVLSGQLTRAGDAYAKDGIRTTIIVDGLDHIPREQNPSRSLLDELPTPAALPLGVCVVLGSQTALILPEPVREALDDDSDGARIVDVPPLADDEVESIATMAGVADWMSPGQLSDLVEISEGHPLVLTYMIQDLRNCETESNEEVRRNLAGHMLTSAAEYRGSIDQRYSRYLGSLAKDDDGVFAILGTVCRLRIPVDLRWLETWVEAAAVTRFADLTDTFFRREDNEWSFIHNSFRRFLVDQTAMVGGQIRDWKSRQLHEHLADQCAASTDWPQYRDEELAQRYLAGQFQQVLDAATPADLRASLFAGRPHGVVRDQAIVVLRAAAEAQDYRALNRSLMFLNELHQRDYVIDADTMAKVMSYVAPERAVEHVVQGRSLRIKTPAALEVAAGLAADNSLESAESIVRAVGGLQGLAAGSDRSRARPQDWAQSVADWAEVLWHRSGLERVLDELDHLLPFPQPIVEANNTKTSDDSRDDLSATTTDSVSDSAHMRAGDGPVSDPAGDSNEDSPDNPASVPADPPVDEGATQPTDSSAETADGGAAYGSAGLNVEDDRWKAERDAREANEARAAVMSARNAVHARCFDLADSVRDGEALSRLAERINAECSPDWRARMHVVSARTAQRDGDSAEVLRQAQLLLAIEIPAKPEFLDSNLVEVPISTAKKPHVDSSAVPADLARPVEPIVDARPVVDINHSNPSSDGATADDADNMEEDEEEAAPARRHRLSLSLRVAAANALAMSGQAHADEFRDLLPPETKPAWPDFFGSSDGLESYKTMLLVLRLRELHHLIGIYEAIPEAGLEVPRLAHDPARTRFVAALTVVAQLEAQAIASSLGLADNPDVPAFANPVIRLLELPHTTTRDWTGWYRIPGAGIELIAGLVPLAYQCGGDAQLKRLLARFKAAWDNPDRAIYWPARRRVAVIRAAAAFGQAAEWCSKELDEAEALVVDEGEPHGRATTWLEFAKARTDIADHDNAITAVGRAHRDGWGPGQHDKDHQLVAWLSWLTEAANLAVIDQTTFLEDACTYAARLLAASGEAGRQASEAAGDLIIAVFQRDAGLATNMAEALCERGVITEPDTITALLRGAAQRADADPELVASLLTELLMPLSPDTPQDLERTLLDLSTNEAALTERFTHARSLWSVLDPQRDSDGVAAPAAGPSTVAKDGLGLPLAAILGQMRSHRDLNVSAGTAQRWSHSIEQFTDSVPLAVAVAVLEQVERLQLGNLDVARAAGIASRAGATDKAREALSRILARSTPYGWQLNWDGGSRIRLFEAAIRDSTDDLVDLAARDLAGLVASKAIAGEFFPRDLKRFAELFGGADLVAQCWADIRDYLDVFAPARVELKGLIPTAADQAESELIAWTAQQLGHPIRIIDFGARRVLAQNYARHQAAIEVALAEAVAAGGWWAEAALHVLVRVGVETRPAITEPVATPATPAGLPPALVSALQDAAVSADAINRHLAAQALSLNGLDSPMPPRVDLPSLYGIDLPPLPNREIPELDRRGVPFIDASDPQQIIAPYDAVLRAVAGHANINAGTLYYRAASLGQAIPNRWTDGGHNAHFERLSSRGTRHVYRPWAYMIGRRGYGSVLAELIDAHVLPHGPQSLWLSVVVDDILNWIAPHPLDQTTPLPWRAPDSKDYASEEWCDQTKSAAAHYAAQFANNHVLCEDSEWRWLTWETPEETRRVRTRHGKVRTSTLFTANPVTPTIETTIFSATGYPALPDLSWSYEELVVRGRPSHSDPERFDWLALHPAVADVLGWSVSDTAFEWIGNDGLWRARSIFHVRGQLSHRPPSDATCAEVWQVVLSDQGWSELAAKFSDLERTVKVNRVLKPNQKKQQDRLEKCSAVTIADTSS
ncbi:ATP-binding protein [Rhodococcus fascians]|uniref:ATP-binding protein n=1 Tax=Rhodococcoides fascians TaxID=1828 RepID=UPI0024B67F0F|nr:ATP-binding protein [Rhodococcus fascians]MDJ0004807.1 ATP-binding protein [Rhodococcus fascians]